MLPLRVSAVGGMFSPGLIRNSRWPSIFCSITQESSLMNVSSDVTSVCFASWGNSMWGLLGLGRRDCGGECFIHGGCRGVLRRGVRGVVVAGRPGDALRQDRALVAELELA